MKLKIENDELSEEFFSDTLMIGIVSAVKGYKFCWSINHHLSIDFRSHPDLEIHLEKKRLQYYFNIYSYQDAELNTINLLYENESRGEYLVPELKHLDYLWLLRLDDTFDQTKKDLLLDKLRKLDFIQMASFLNIDHIRSRENLII
jgi:hypothetical protein